MISVGSEQPFPPGCPDSTCHSSAAFSMEPFDLAISALYYNFVSALPADAARVEVNLHGCAEIVQ